jgi:hypothetical protein
MAIKKFEKKMEIYFFGVEIQRKMEINQSFKTMFFLIKTSWDS